MTVIALCSKIDYLIVLVGSTIGVLISTSIAICGGQYLSKKVSKFTINLTSGALFIFCSFQAFYNAFKWILYKYILRLIKYKKL